MDKSDVSLKLKLPKNQEKVDLQGISHNGGILIKSKLREDFWHYG